MSKISKNFKKILAFFFSLVLFSSVSTTALAASPQLEKSQIIKTQSVASTSSSKYVTEYARVQVYIHNYKIDNGYKLGDVVPYFTDADGYSGQLKCVDMVRDSDYDIAIQHLTAGDSYQGYLTYVFGGTVTK